MLKKLLFISLFSVIFVLKQAEPLECIICEWSAFSPEVNRDCYDISNLPSDNLEVLECNQTAPFCKTEFTFVEDVVVEVFRNCTNGAEDWDKSDISMPSQEKCVTDFNSEDLSTQRTTCYLACNNGAGCNNDDFKQLSDINFCSNECGPNGKCDYNEGVCECDEGYGGPLCREIVPLLEHRKCIQCDSETMINCGIYDEPSNCTEITDRYCAVVSITKYDKEGNVTRSFISRSCTNSYQVGDECFISNAIESGGNEVEYTCVSTCDVDGCNRNTPNGIVDHTSEDSGEASGEEIQPIRCVVCDSDFDRDCVNKTSTDVCPSHSTHCMSTVTFYLSEKQDLRYEAEPEYELESVVRGCTNESVETSCEKMAVGRSSLIKTVCTETCSIDGCNIGWPATPKCSQCLCERCTLEDECNSNPPIPTECPFPYQEFCTIQDVDRYVDLDGKNHGYPRMLKRGCSYKGIGNSTSVTTFGRDGVPLESLNRSCTQNGCNLGYYPFIQNSAKGLQTSSLLMLVFTLFTVLLWI